MGLLSVFSRSQDNAPPLPSILFPTNDYTASTGEWTNGVYNLPDDLDRACRLRRIVHCTVVDKAGWGTHADFVLVYVRHPSGKEAIFCAERAPSDEGSSLGIAPSRDRVLVSSAGTIASHAPGGWAEIHAVKFPKASDAPSVAHLAVLFTVLGRHTLSRSTSAGVRSGWFAYCVAEVMGEVFLGVGKTQSGWVRAPYGGLSVDGRDTVDALIREFTPAWEDFSRRRARPTERASKRREEEAKKNKKKAEMDSFADMLRTMNP